MAHIKTVLTQHHQRASNVIGLPSIGMLLGEKCLQEAPAGPWDRESRLLLLLSRFSKRSSCNASREWPLAHCNRGEALKAAKTQHGVTCVQRVLCVLSVEPWSDLCPACPVYVEFGGHSKVLA